MIIIYHSHNKVDAVWNHTESVDIPLSSPIIVEQLLAIAQAYPKVLLVWCHTTLKDHLQTDVLKNIFQHKKLLVSYNTTDTPYLGHTIGYINASPFIKIKKNVL